MSRKEAIQFLQWLRPEGPWNLSSIDPETGFISSTLARSQQDIADFLAAYEGHLNCYYSANLAPNPTGWKLKATNKDITEADFVYTDVDPYKPGDAVSKEEALQRIRAYRHKPSAIVDTGGGFQPLYRLRESTDPKVSESINRGLIEDLHGDENVWTAEHLLRLPGTLNIPNAKKRELGRKEVEARIVELNDVAYDELDFRPGKPAPPKVEYLLDMGDPVITDDLQQLADEYGLPQNLVEDIAGNMPKEGERSGHVFSVVSRLIRFGVPDEVIYGLEHDSRYALSTPALELEDDDKIDRRIRRDIQHAHERIGNPALDFADDDGLEEALAKLEGRPLMLGEKKAEDRHMKVAKFKRWRISELLQLPPPRWLIHNLVTEFGASQVVGVRKKGKTFFVLDMALHIAMGLEFHGHEVLRKPVTYIIAEGSKERFFDRMRAWCYEYKVDINELEEWFFLVPVPVHVDDPETLVDFYAADPSHAGIIFIDTVARNMQGDENGTKDMNAFVAGIDWLRAVYHCAVLVVHHVGKDESKGGRGSTALPGAVDLTITVTPLKAGTGKRGVMAKVTEFRDGEEGETLSFEFAQHMVDPDDMRYSVALRFLSSEKVSNLPNNAAEQALILIAEMPGHCITDRSDLYSTTRKGFSRANVNKAIKWMQDEGYLTGSGPFNLTEKGMERALEMGAVVE